ncbi:MAG: cbb3-type cytochrome c oxidase subunit I [Saprospiraceae bacterium]|nr:cbb3-type cytochrome c oxidase subunit I [Saprospiraceae bacterium]
MRLPTGERYLYAALAFLCLGLFFGLTAGIYYLGFDNLSWLPGFEMLRPLHVTSIMLWILMGATGCVYTCLSMLDNLYSRGLAAQAQGWLWAIAAAGIFWSYSKGHFGGREYWEFNPVWALPIALAWLLFLYQFLRSVRNIRNWPVYLWMWTSGIFFFLFAFTESYLWIFPYFREHFVTDMTVQWKSNGSLVGAWNQLLYGTSFFLMERISKNTDATRNRLAFAMYFLGLFNLMFNWGHHIYTLPTAAYVRYTGYLVSMTEWIIFARIIYLWKNSLEEGQKHFHYFPYRFLMAADVWLLLNLGQALLMSIPAFNLYTHGTHVTVAHAMGTTIGINSMILFAACYMFLDQGRMPGWFLRNMFWLAQASLLLFWLALNGAGIMKGLWQRDPENTAFAVMMKQLRPFFYAFWIAGLGLAIALGALAINLLRTASTRMKPVMEK